MQQLWTYIIVIAVVVFLVVFTAVMICCIRRRKLVVWDETHLLDGRNKLGNASIAVATQATPKDREFTDYDLRSYASSYDAETVPTTRLQTLESLLSMLVTAHALFERLQELHHIHQTGTRDPVYDNYSHDVKLAIERLETAKQLLVSARSTEDNQALPQEVRGLLLEVGPQLDNVGAYCQTLEDCDTQSSRPFLATRSRHSASTPNALPGSTSNSTTRPSPPLYNSFNDTQNMLHAFVPPPLMDVSSSSLDVQLIGGNSLFGRYPYSPTTTTTTGTVENNNSQTNNTPPQSTTATGPPQPTIEVSPTSEERLREQQPQQQGEVPAGSLGSGSRFDATTTRDNQPSTVYSERTGVPAVVAQPTNAPTAPQQAGRQIIQHMQQTSQTITEHTLPMQERMMDEAKQRDNIMGALLASLSEQLATENNRLARREQSTVLHTTHANFELSSKLASIQRRQQEHHFQLIHDMQDKSKQLSSKRKHLYKLFSEHQKDTTSLPHHVNSESFHVHTMENIPQNLPPPPPPPAPLPPTPSSTNDGIAVLHLEHNGGTGGTIIDKDNEGNTPPYCNRKHMIAERFNRRRKKKKLLRQELQELKEMLFSVNLSVGKHEQEVQKIKSLEDVGSEVRQMHTKLNEITEKKRQPKGSGKEQLRYYLGKLTENRERRKELNEVEQECTRKRADLALMNQTTKYTKYVAEQEAQRQKEAHREQRNKQKAIEIKMNNANQYMLDRWLLDQQETLSKLQPKQDDIPLGTPDHTVVLLKTETQQDKNDFESPRYQPLQRYKDLDSVPTPFSNETEPETEDYHNTQQGDMGESTEDHIFSTAQVMHRPPYTSEIISTPFTPPPPASPPTEHKRVVQIITADGHSLDHVNTNSEEGNTPTVTATSLTKQPVGGQHKRRQVHTIQPLPLSSSPQQTPSPSPDDDDTDPVDKPKSVTSWLRSFSVEGDNAKPLQQNNQSKSFFNLKAQSGNVTTSRLNRTLSYYDYTGLSRFEVESEMKAQLPARKAEGEEDDSDEHEERGGT